MLREESDPGEDQGSRWTVPAGDELSWVHKGQNPTIEHDPLPSRRIVEVSYRGIRGERGYSLESDNWLDSASR
jgi:hypothetical protein